MESISAAGAAATPHPYPDTSQNNEIEISWRLDSRAAKRIRWELGLNPILWCETPSPDVDTNGRTMPSLADVTDISEWDSADNKVGHKKSCRFPRAVEPRTRPEPWSSLSQELFLHIFKYLEAHDLASCARVCSKWKQIVYDDSLWRTISIHEMRIPPKLIFFAIKRNPRRLSIVNCDMIDFDEGESDVTVSEMQERKTIACTRMDLSSTRIFDRDVVRLVQMAPLLSVLDLGNTTVTDATLFAVAKHCPNLDSLSLRMVPAISEAGVKAVLKSCQKLRVLSLGWATMSMYFARHIANHCRQIEHLDLSGCCHEMTDELVEEITKAAPKLQTLDLSDCYELTDECIYSIVENLPNIKTVSLSRNHRITLDAMWKLTSVETLRNINLFGCYPNVFPEIKAKRHNLEVNEQALTILPPFM